MKSTRKSYGEFLVDMGTKNANIVVFDADLAKATCTVDFKNKFPDRHFDMGIAEQDMIGTACGMAISGKTVFTSSFAMFAAGRAYEQIRNTAAYSHVNINICATHTGLGVGEDGATHQCIEDIALMNVIPDMNVFSPSDDISTHKILMECLNLDMPKYIRLGRNELPSIYSLNDEFHLGGSHTFGNGIDGTIFATGSTVCTALEAKMLLKEKGYDVRVIDLYSIKPIDKATIIQCAKETNKLISIEDHSVIGGIGSIISSVLCEEFPKKLVKLGIQDKFGKSGKAEKLYELYNLTKEDVIEAFIMND
ncbi:MAG: transketolase C-terminal domain-containing protein [Clostridia bacterium]|nr:transketolase C-terminal domain-containing protein [Clostridia bacterium]